MAKLIIKGSSSKGNGYILQCGKESLLIEAGRSYKEVALTNDLSNAVALLCSHLHSDHSKYVDTYIERGIDVYSCKETKDKYANVKVLSTKKKYKIGGFYVQCLNVTHNCECYSFIIQHDEIGKVLFATDLNGFPYNIKGLNHIFIEANFSEDIIIDNMCNDKYSRSASDNHLEINETISILKRLYNIDLQTIVLLHLSSGNSNERLFREMVQKELSFNNVIIANTGVEVELNKEEF